MRPKLYALPTQRREQPAAEALATALDVPDEPAARERLGTWARAVDESAAATEAAVRTLRGLRADLLAGRRPDVQVLALSLMAHLSATADVLGEVHVGLDELTHELPGGAA